MKINWKQKLSSRKFWALLGAVALALLPMLGITPATTESIIAVISAVGACVAYMLAEGIVDAKRENTSSTPEQ